MNVDGAFIWVRFITYILVMIYFGWLMYRLWSNSAPLGGDFWDRFNEWLKVLAATNFKTVVGAFLAVSTAFFYFGSELRCIFYERSLECRPIDSVNFGLWLGFVAAWAGLSYVQFAKKRETQDSKMAPDALEGYAADPTAPAKDQPTKEEKQDAKQEVRADKKEQQETDRDRNSGGIA